MSVLLAVAAFSAESLASYFIGKGLDKFFEKKDDFVQELSKVINNTLGEYEKLYPQQDIGRQFAFYKSQKIINELLKYRVMHQNDYDPKALLISFETEVNVIPPEKEQIEKFYTIFQEKINSNEKLKQLEIKKTFESEIFLISQKLDTLHRYIENVLLSFSADLELQWKDRIDVYISTLQQFKPQTALSLLEALENSFTQSTKKPPKEFSSLISYQKGVCYSFLDDKDNMCESFVSAYRNNPSDIRFIEKAALSYYKIGELGNANQLVEKILVDKEFNPIAWSLKVMSGSIGLIDIPEFVKKNILLQKTLYNFFNAKKESDSVLQMEQLSMIPKSKDFVENEITINSFDENVFYANVFLSEYLKNYYFAFHFINDGNIEIIKTLNKLLSGITLAISGSELEKKCCVLFFLYSYTEYIITKEKKYVYKMKEYYHKIEDKNCIFTLICANCLQLNDEIDSALNILLETKNVESDLIALKAFCYLRKNELDFYRKSIKEWIDSINVINKWNIDSYLSSLFIVKSIGESDDIELSDFIFNKKLESRELELLLTTIVNCIKTGCNKDYLEDLELLASFYKDDYRIISYVANTYYYCKDYVSAINIYKNIVNIEKRELFFYINSLYAAKTDSNTLLELLERWRRNFTFQEDLLKIEADLRRILCDWKECYNICELFLDKYPNDEAFLSLKLISLDGINEEWCKSEISKLANVFLNYSFSIIRNIPIVTNVLINNGFHKEAVCVIYNHSNNKEIRPQFIIASIAYSQNTKNKDILIEYDTVVDGCFIKYEYNRETYFKKINVNEDEKIASILIGHKVGDIVSLSGRMTGNEYSIKILRIMDKYLCLHDEILEEAKQPLSGMPFESFKFESTEPEEIKKTLISALGQQGDEIKYYREKEINNYYERTSSFSEVIIRAFSNDYLGGYFNLITEHSGISITPIQYYNSMSIESNTDNFIIDFSSLTILYQTARENDIKYPHKFLVSRFIVESLKGKLREMQKETKSEFSIVITSQGIEKYLRPENLHQSNITYISGLIDWIKNNCEEIVSNRVADFKRKLNPNFEQAAFIDYVLNTTLVREDKNCTLITDDMVYFKYRFAQISGSVSTEWYIKKCLGEDHTALFEFVRNKYRGFSLNEKLLIDEFDKKIKSQDNYYSFCVENLNPGVASLCVNLIKKIISSNLEKKQKRVEIQNVFIGIFKNTHKNNDRINVLFKRMLVDRFNHSKSELKLVISCLDNAFSFLGIE